MISVNEALILALALLPAHAIAQVCGNDAAFGYLANKKERSCKWFRFKDSRREKFCLIAAVNAACKHTCGRCCEDDPTYIFERDNGKKGRCKWVGGNKKRMKRFCVKEKTKHRNGRSIRDACPATCNYCFTDVQITASPTVSSTPTVTIITTAPVTSVPTKLRAPTMMPQASPSIGPTKVPLEWAQMGSDIIGEAVGDGSGSSVSLSDDGKIVAIGAPLNKGSASQYSSGHVRVYIYSDATGAWTQMGDDINGEDRSGHSVSLSSDGTVLAIGPGGYTVAVEIVRIYNYSDTNGGTWVQMGGDIVGEEVCDESDYSVSLSNDGTVVAIGARYNSNANGSYSGHVRIYNYSDTTGGSWIQMGDDIDGEAPYDNSGCSVSLSNDGKTIAIGATNNDGGAKDDAFYNTGHVRIYNYSDTTGGSWIQMGGDIDGEAGADNSGHSVSLSNDGKTIAIGAPGNEASTGQYSSGHVMIYNYSDTTGAWVQMGGDIDGEAESDTSGYSVSLSDDGKTVAIGAPGNEASTGQQNSGHVRIYTYSGDTNPPSWNQMGGDIDAEAESNKSGYSVSLSNDGKIVAIGSPGLYDTFLPGHVRIYNWH